MSSDLRQLAQQVQSGLSDLELSHVAGILISIAQALETQERRHQKEMADMEARHQEEMGRLERRLSELEEAQGRRPSSTTTLGKDPEERDTP